jgi:hypothetical protein
MTDKQVTVAVPDERVPEFYAWFGAFLASEPGTPPPSADGERRARRGRRHHGEVHAWSADDADQAAWLYGELAPPARALFDLLIEAPEHRFAGEDIARRLELQKGAHGVAGILAWPGRYCRRLERPLPIATDGRDDGGTDYSMDAEIAELFAAARTRPLPDRGGRHRRSSTR